jgi:hypothetical protein
MTLLLLEALGALLIFVFIIWWTMFSGRSKGELRDEEGAEENQDSTSNAKTQRREERKVED